MSVLLADIDATCASLGYNDGSVYHPEADAVQGLKHLIWILRRDGETHEYRRYIGRGKVLQTDLLPMLMHHAGTATTADDELADVLLRLLVNLTSPALLLYRDELPKDGPGRRNFLELIEVLQGYKAAFALQPVWTALGKRLQTVLEIDWAERREEQGLLIERCLVLVRNVLTVPASPDTERRADNDASLHDQVLWALQQSGVLELVLYLLGTEAEHQYHLHALEIVCLMYREQTAASLADASLQRTGAEKLRDEQELVAARRRERARLSSRPPAVRHSRFGGTFVLSNVQSVSGNDIICHHSLTRTIAMDFGREKADQKRSYRVVKEQGELKRRSALSVRLFLREFCVEILESAFNLLIRQVRRTLERAGTGHDDSYLLWALRFCMEFNRLSGFKLHLVSEALSTQCFHWVLGRVQHHLDMIVSDKKNARSWGKRLHIAMQAYKELLLSVVALQRVGHEDAQALYRMLENNVCYVMEFRETMLHTLMNYQEAVSTKAYLADVVEVCHIFCKIMEHFCKDGVLVQHKKTQRRIGKRAKNGVKKAAQSTAVVDRPTEEELHNRWATSAGQISAILTADAAADDGFGGQLPEHERPVPYDAVAEQSMADQKDGCTVRIHAYLRQEKFEHAVSLLRSAREVWPDDECFGSATASAEEELMMLRDIFVTDLGEVDPAVIDGPAETENGVDNDDDEDDEEDEEDDDGGRMKITETDLRFEDFEKRLLNPKIVYACTTVLADWEKLEARSVKSAVTLLHRIAFNCKSPAMLYQASLFRVFQAVFHAAHDSRGDELRRLATYVVRQFVQVAPGNPKVYAELLFYKSLREANDLESNYDGALDGGDSKKKWTEEQEDELRQLYMENQNNPETDKDVIDWIHDNLIDGSRTRRAIIFKLKELGLIFRAPTKRSNAQPKNSWLPEHDEQLRELYDQNRAEDDALKRIMAALQPTRSKKLVIDKMIQLRLIADRSEILPSKRKRAKKPGKAGGRSSDDDNSGSDDSDDEREEHAEPGENNAAASKRTNHGVSKKSKQKQPLNKPLDFELLRTLLDAVETQFQPVLAWLEESLNDAVDDLNDDDGQDADPDDCVPLVPFSGEQRDGLEDAGVQKLLATLGMQPPGDDEATSYWRIPQHWRADDLKLRARIVSGAFDFEAAHIAEAQAPASPSPATQHNDASDDSEEDYDFEANRRRQTSLPSDKLVYTHSDDEDDGHKPAPPSESVKDKKASSKKKAAKKFDIFDMIREPEEKEGVEEEGDAPIEPDAETGERNDDNGSDDEPDEVEVNVSRKPAKRMVIEDSDDEDNDAGGLDERPASRAKRDRSQDADDSDGEQVTNRTAIKRKRTAVIEDDDDE